MSMPDDEAAFLVRAAVIGAAAIVERHERTWRDRQHVLIAQGRSALAREAELRANALEHAARDIRWSIA